MHDEYVSRASGLHTSLRILSRQKWLILVVLLVTPAVTLYFSRESPLYRASAQVIFDPQTLATTLTGIPSPSSSRPIATQAELAHESGIAAKVVARAGISGVTPGGLLAASSISAMNDVDGLVFSVTDSRPDVARRLATAYARQFAVYRRQVDSRIFAATRRLLDSQIASRRASGDLSSPLYKSLVEKRQLIETAQALYTTDILITKPAQGAAKIRPRPMRSGVLAFGLAVLAALGLALVREALDTRVRTAEELVHGLGLPLLARIPSLPRRVGFRRKRRPFMLERPASVYAESVRMLRTGLGLTSFLDERSTTGVVVQLTSALAREGKSTTSADLAIAFARSGRRVVLVDLDVRRPAIASLFQRTPDLGVTDIVLRQASVDDVIIRIPVGTVGALRDAVRNGGGSTEAVLELIPAGVAPADVEAFVRSERLAAMLDELRRRADIVVVDAPPLLHVGDAIELSALTDAIVLVSRLGVVRRPMLAELRRLLAICPALKLGVVVIGSSAEKTYSPYYYGGAVPSGFGALRVERSEVPARGWE